MPAASAAFSASKVAFSVASTPLAQASKILRLASLAPPTAPSPGFWGMWCPPVCHCRSRSAAACRARLDAVDKEPGGGSSASLSAMPRRRPTPQPSSPAEPEPEAGQVPTHVDMLIPYVLLAVSLQRAHG